MEATAATGCLLASGSAWSLVRSSDRLPTAEEKAYLELLKAWCDGLVEHQLTMENPAFHGGLLCPSCALIHGRCGDAVYPLLKMAHVTGDTKYVRAAKMLHEWSQVQVTHADGSWTNDVALNSWQGITVFHSIALAEALQHHGEVLDAATRAAWTDRLAQSAKFLNGFMTIETGNVNYPVTSSLAFVLCGQVLGDAHYMERGRGIAHTALDYFSPNGFLYGEGHPQKGITPKGCRTVDLGYNVEESLPALALYALLTKDKPVLDQVIVALKTHMEFMLPDGAWDNSWGTRNYKWAWWGSRTTDGCHPGYVLLAEHEPKFREVARRNLELMAGCTHNGLLYGGPDYFEHGDLPCIHHTFTHAKALATVLDRGNFSVGNERFALPREEAYGLKTYPEIGTRLASIGPWRATVTEYDCEYKESVELDRGGGRHATGGALSMLYHRELGPILTASMTEYQILESSNQQVFRDGPHMTLTPRIEWANKQTYTSLNDLKAVVTAQQSAGEIVFDAQGRLLATGYEPIPSGEVRYHMVYKLNNAAVELMACASGKAPAGAPLRLIVPVVSRKDDRVEQVAGHTVRIAKAKGTLTVHTDGAEGFEAVPKERFFNLVPGFEVVPLVVVLQPGKEVRVRIETA